MADQPDFDAADLADAILGLDDPPASAAMSLPPDADLPRANIAPSSMGTGSLGWVLLAALVIAVSIAISMAVQTATERPSSNRVTPVCGGLYSTCCDDWDDNWGPCVEDCEPDHDSDGSESRVRGQGLFDEEADFVPPRDRSRC